MIIKNLVKAANRIKKAIRNNERIILYGHDDVDGITSVIILEETIINLGGKITALHFSDTEKEGYGINKKALNYLKKFAPSLVLALDCGMGNHQAVILAKKLNLEIIIIDHHHQISDKPPEVSIIVNPKQKNDKYYFKELANAGIVYKLSQLLLSKKIAKILKKNFLELVALATLSDMMPEIDENQGFMEKGLATLENTQRLGLRAFFEIGIAENCNSIKMLAQKINSALNTSQKKNHSNEMYLLLTSSDIEEAKILAQKLSKRSNQKKIEVRKVVQEINEKIAEKSEEPIIFENINKSLSLTGSVASKICNQYQKPTFIFKMGKEESIGLVRIPENFNAIELMKGCSLFLKAFGGHAPAAGFRLKNKNLEKFKNCLIEKYTKLISKK